VVIPCGAGKQDTAAPAAELYTGSMFTLALTAARTLVDDSHILILSARHGLVALDQVLEPYDVKMGGPLSVDPIDLTDQMIDLGWDADDVDIYHLLPKTYRDCFEAACRDLYLAPAEVYEATHGIGEHRGICAQIRDN
jgi:hypothetical protein